MIDVHAVNKKKVKKVHRFLCARCKKKKKKAKKVNKKNKDAINILSDSYSLHGIYSPIHITPKSLSEIFFSFFGLFILHFVIIGKASALVFLFLLLC